RSVAREPTRRLDPERAGRPSRSSTACTPPAAAGARVIPRYLHRGRHLFLRRTAPRKFGDTFGDTHGPTRFVEASYVRRIVDAEEGNRTPKPLRAGDFESIPTADSGVEHEPRRCFYSTSAARAIRPFMACAVEKADKTRTAAFYLAPARALRPHG